MEVTGVITKILDIESGVSKKTGKEWKTQSFIIDNNEQYNNIFCFDLFGDEKIENFNKYNKVGSNVKVDFNVVCREYEGKYYTSLSAWKICKAESNLELAAQKIENAFPGEVFEKVVDLNKDKQDDLPF